MHVLLLFIICCAIMFTYLVLRVRPSYVPCAGDILWLVSQDDHNWPSERFADIAVERCTRKGEKALSKLQVTDAGAHRSGALHSQGRAGAQQTPGN